jgi:hypothetical protein
MLPKKFNRDDILAIVVMTVILGWLGLAFVDPSTRPYFADLSKITVSAYLGFRGGKGSQK